MSNDSDHSPEQQALASSENSAVNTTEWLRLAWVLWALPKESSPE